jgi:hypothetical protein
MCTLDPSGPLIGDNPEVVLRSTSGQAAPAESRLRIRCASDASRKIQRKRRAACAAHHLDFASVRPHDRFHDRKTEAGILRRSLSGSVDAIKTVENFLDMLGPNILAAIRNLYRYILTRAGRSHCHFGRDLGMLQCI